MSSPYDRMTDRARKIVDYSLREALALGHNYVGTEHILLGLVREDKGLAGIILESLGLERQQVRDEVMRAFGGGLRRRCPTCGERKRAA